MKKKIYQRKVQKTHNTHFMFNNFSSENRAFDEKMWENAVKPDRPNITDNMEHGQFMLDN